MEDYYRLRNFINYTCNFHKNIDIYNSIDFELNYKFARDFISILPITFKHSIAEAFYCTELAELN